MEQERRIDIASASLPKRRRNSLNLIQVRNTIERNRKQGLEAIKPTTLSGRFRKAVVDRIPFTPLRTALEIAPLETAVNNLRGPVVDLYNNMGDIIREGRDMMESNEQISSLLQEVEQNPQDQGLLRQLRDLMREKAMEELNIQSNPDTEELMQEILEPEDPVKKQAIREKTIDEAKRLLDVTETVALIGDTLARHTAQTFETVAAEYAQLHHIRRAVKVLHKSGFDIIKAQEERINAFNTLSGQLDILLATTELASKVQKITEEGQRTFEAEEIKVLKQKAFELNERSYSSALPSGEERKKELKAPVSDQTQ